MRWLAIRDGAPHRCAAAHGTSRIARVAEQKKFHSAVQPTQATNRPKPPARPFRKRYDELEARRVHLLERLEKLGDAGRKHSGFNSALSLLNVQFRRAKLVQRAAVLQSAWMIDLLERIAMML
jgi:hypothetical protein